jgi:23S rRNA (cytidine1920-2'-O)/16S rRNA (cytidine1409-2'-O)-methyltransferase
MRRRARSARGPERVGRGRVDELLVARGLAATRAEALRLVMAGRVLVAGAPVDKAGRLVPGDAELALTAVSPYVGRGGEKLRGALAAFSVAVAGRVCLDVGASTGGFTDCLLQHGARRVHAIDVGRHQLHPRLRSDPRVSILEGVNARHLTPSRFAEPPSLAVVDVAFISLTKVLPAVARCLDAADGHRAEIVALVKPQFEVGRGRVGKGGVVRDPGRHREVLRGLVAFGCAQDLAPAGIAVSLLAGARGNREFFLHLVVGGTPRGEEALTAAVEAAVTVAAGGRSGSAGCAESA